jgi:hypothetical protein
MRARSSSPLSPAHIRRGAPSAPPEHHAALLRLQRTAGNRAVSRLLAREPSGEGGHAGAPEPTGSGPGYAADGSDHAASPWQQEGHATPSPGVDVSWDGTQLDIQAHVQVIGRLATQEVAGAIAADIERTWTQSFPDGSAIKCRVDAQLGGAPDKGRSQIIVEQGPVSNSHAVSGTIYLMMMGPDDLVWSPAHEFSHLLGLKDERHDTGFLWLGPEAANEGYEHNIMGAITEETPKDKLKVERRNVFDWLDRYAKL